MLTSEKFRYCPKCQQEICLSKCKVDIYPITVSLPLNENEKAIFSIENGYVRRYYCPNDNTNLDNRLIWALDPYNSDCLGKEVFVP